MRGISLRRAILVLVREKVANCCRKPIANFCHANRQIPNSPAHYASVLAAAFFT
jgi:hypothetical protein